MALDWNFLWFSDVYKRQLSGCCVGVTAFGQNRLYDEQGAVDLGNAAKRTWAKAPLTVLHDLPNVTLLLRMRFS